MQEKSLIKKNILYFLDSKGITKYKFYQDTGITRGILDQNNGMSEENIARVLAYYSEISPDWLILGRGDMLRNNQQTTQQESACPHCADKERIIDALKSTISTKDTLINVLLNGKNG